ncbi:LOW QUALITY PROTEIN: hypothetical protein X943_000997 [Babesia divergens]|uniref:Uncharacterized protein n=1 Tax=Babesia divergens TaxID=32595 RepID=A0AAD9GIK2_BABDI|nr:LOW QUALITY PROTEIN: hypothetical protein X943_000997 [Babesia divergens]
MKLLGILRVSALFILLSAFRGPRGVFCSNLKVDPSNESFTVEVSEDHEDSTVESRAIEKPSQEHSESSAPAPKSNLVFENSKWDDSMLANALLFIKEFCEDVMAEKFGGKVSEGLSKACVNVSSYMGSFIHRFKPTYGPGSVTERKEIPMNFYKDVLKAEDFDVYAKWIVKNIPAVLESLGLMSMEYLCMSEKQRETATSMGPPSTDLFILPWGELTHGVNRGLFEDSDILQSFKDLKSSLDDVLKSFPKNSTVKSQAV